MKSIGIDLGTTNSLVSYWINNEPKLIPNILGSNLTPSVVSVDENGEVYVGQIAKERIITHPHLTASNFKRYMGTEKKYKLGKYTFTPEDLSSFIIKSLKADAETFLGCEITNVIISVPAYFSDTQRKSTKRAAKLAGLNVERLISEPTAAAISYGIYQEKLETKFLVFDLGGGTFDVSIVELFESVIDVKSIAGDNFLGGEDFTELLLSHFIQEHNIDFENLDIKTRSILTKQAETCKYQLTNSEEGKMNISIGTNTYESLVNRTKFEKLVNPLLVRLSQPIERALRDANLTTKDIDAIVLIGGATKMPVIKSSVSKIFNNFPLSTINPDESVALGCAIQIALKERNQSLDEFILTDVCPYSLGTNVSKDVGNGYYKSGYFLPIIERNTPIPVSRSQILQTIVDNQTSINVEIYQGESRNVENNIKIGELNITVSPAPAGEQLINIRYTYDVNGILEVDVEALKTGVKKRLILEKSPGSMTKAEIDQRFEELKQIKIHPCDRIENKLLLSRGERIYEESLGEKREYVSSLLYNFERILLKQNDKEIQFAAKNLKKILDEIEGSF